MLQEKQRNRDLCSRIFEKGIIAEWYLRRSQRPLYRFIQNKPFSVVLAHRRFGKTTTIFTHICERAQAEKIIIRCGGVTQSKIFEIVTYILDEIYQYAPHLRPKYSSAENVSRFLFPSGSEMFLFGNSDSKECDKGRGSKADIIYCDERAFWRFKPSYMLRSILMPQVDNIPGAQVILTSSAPEDLSHPFLDEIREASSAGNLFNQTVEDTLRMGDISDEEHERIIIRCGGRNSDSYQREYLNSLIPTKASLVIPEAQDEALYVEDWERPPYLDSYVSMDLGFRDFTFVCFGYLDFRNATFIIEDELQINYESTKQIVERCKEIEERLGYKPYRRIADNELQQIADMNREHNYIIKPIVKRSKQSNQGFRDSIINNLRIAISTGKVKINPRCKKLIAQLKYGIWNEARSDFERSESLGHLDGIMSLGYLLDNVDYARNPYPAILPGCDRFNSYIPTGITKSKTIESFEQAFGKGRKG